MIESVVLTVTDMKCGGCETNVTGKLRLLRVLFRLKHRLKRMRLVSIMILKKPRLEAIKATIIGAGFRVKAINISKFSLGKFYEYRRDF